MRVEPIKKLKKILTTLAMLSIIFCALIMPAQSEQNDVESPTANFFAFSTSGDAPFDAAFMDTSTGNPTEWYWEFGDGDTSTKQDPDHTYSELGSYTVILTATNDAGSDVVTKAGYITVTEPKTDDTEYDDTTDDTYEEDTYEEDTYEDDASPSKSVSLSYLQLAATSDPERSQGGTTPEAVDSVKIVESALVKAGFLADNSYAYDGSYGINTIKAYRDWQESLGSAEEYCDGIPREKDLTKLGDKYGFTVDDDTVDDYYEEDTYEEDTYEEDTYEENISPSKSVSLSYLQVAAKTDPARPQGGTTPEAVDSVKIVESALVKAGFLADNSYAYDGSYGTNTIKAYREWQESLGSAEEYCDGIPGEKDLTKLGDKYGFTVDSSSISDSDPSDSNADTNFNTPVYKQPAQTTQGSGSDLSETESMPVKSTDTSKGSIFSWKYWSNKLSNPVLAATQEQAPSSSSDPISERVVYTAVNTPEVPFSDGFDFPVGWPNGDGYKHGTVNDKNGWDFLEYEKPKNIYHPGEDWNGIDDSGNPVGNADFGDPVYAISNGRVTYASYYSDAWGNIILIEHRLQDGTPVWSQYAHLKDMLVSSGDIVQRGQKIGTIGKDDGVAHLHFEIRKKELKAGAWDVSSETKVSEDYYDPSDFINSHRPKKDSTQTDSTQTGSTQTGSTMPTTAKESLWESLWHSIEKMTKAKPKYVDDPGDTGIHLA